MRYLLLSVFFLTLTLQAQPVSSAQTETQKRELSESDFEQAKQLYLKMLDSPNWIKATDIAQSIAYNSGRSSHPRMNDSLFIPWVKENLHLTKFKSVDEVQSLVDTMAKAYAEVNKENLPLYKLMGKASREQLDIIMKPLMYRSNEHFIKN